MGSAETTAGVNSRRLAELLAREGAEFDARHPRSRQAWQQAMASLIGGVPMTWMLKSAGGYPVMLETAQGAAITDADGQSYVDFCLGDTGAMAGHSPQPVVDAVTDRFARRGGAATMLPTEDAAAVGRELATRFGVERWSFTLTATDANRWVIRLARQLTGRPKVLVFNYCYHGSVDESFVVLAGGRAVARPGNVGAGVDPTTTTKVVEFNDLPALEAALSTRDVACVLMEPALTNIGIVPPEPGFLDGVRAATRATGTLLVNDETHTFCLGPGGATAAWDLEPDAVTIGKAIAGGIPIGAYGLRAELADRVLHDPDADIVDTGGVGGTLAGNPLSLAAARATLESVLTADAFAEMAKLAERFRAGVADAIEHHALPWSVTRLGAPRRIPLHRAATSKWRRLSRCCGR